MPWVVLQPTHRHPCLVVVCWCGVLTDREVSCHCCAVLSCCICSLVASSKFGLQADKTFSAKANALMSTFYFGLPLPGYTVITGDQYDEQVSKVRGRQ